MNVMTSIDTVSSSEPVEDQTSWVVGDTETTGMEAHDQVIEWANVWPGARWSTLIKPTVPIHCAARANHHITDEELKDKLTFAEWLERNGEHKPFGNARYLVAHNAAFDVQLLKQSGLPEELFPEKMICTLICAKHLWPEAPSYKNQALRYHFDLQFTPEEKKVMKRLIAHRAPYDAIVTTSLFRLMLTTHTLDQLEQLTRTPVLLRICSYKPHVGVPWKDVDRGFLNWMIGKGVERIENGIKVGFPSDVIYTAKYYSEAVA